MEDYYGIKSRRAREYIRSLPFKKKIPWKAMFPKTSDLALDLLERLLAFNPVKRITVEDALKHPYLEPYHDPDDEPTADPIPEEFFDFDKNKDNLTKEQLKRTLADASRGNMLIFYSSYLPGDYAVMVRRWVGKVRTTSRHLRASWLDGRLGNYHVLGAIQEAGRSELVPLRNARQTTRLEFAVNICIVQAVGVGIELPPFFLYNENKHPRFDMRPFRFSYYIFYEASGSTHDRYPLVGLIFFSHPFGHG